MPTGSRRMINPVITDTGSFLMMPVSTRELYFQLSTHADDDGVVEAYTIMRLVGAKEDDMAILVAKRYVTVLDKDLQLIWINHWFEHNNIRSDVLVPSEHRELLVSVIPGLSLKESKRDEDTKRRMAARKAVRNGHGTDTLRICNESDTSPSPSIDKDSIDKLSKEKETNTNVLVPFSNGYALWMDEWTKAMGFPITKKLKENENALKACIKDSSAETMHQVIGYLHWLKTTKKSKERPHWFQYVTGFIKIRSFWDSIMAAMTDDSYQQYQQTQEYNNFFNR